MNNKLILPVAIVIAGILIAGAIVLVNSSGRIEGLITAEEASNKVVGFLNNTILQGGETADIVETVEESSVYKVKFSVQGEEVEWMISRDGKLLFPQSIDIDELTKDEEGGGGEITLGNFQKTGDELCEETGRPIVYFFGSESCPHCQWEHPVMKTVAAKFGDYISFHDNMDTDDDSEVFAKYNQEGYIPATLIGCKYFRVGSGENIGLEENTKNLTALICDLTGGQPGEVCGEVQELIDEI